VPILVLFTAPLALVIENPIPKRAMKTPSAIPPQRRPGEAHAITAALILLAGINLLSAQGSLDPGFSTGSGAEDAVQTLAVQSDGKIIAAGLFFNINGAANSLGIGRLNTNGVVDTTFNPGTSVDFGISSVAVQSDGKIILGGGFTMYQGASRNGSRRRPGTGRVK